MLQIVQGDSKSYYASVVVNAKKSNFTIEFSFGLDSKLHALLEKFTVGECLVIDISMPSIDAARMIFKAMRAMNVRDVNVSGVDIAILLKNGWTQDAMNEYVHAAISKVNEFWKINSVGSSGQSGAELAALISAYALGIQACAYMPKGFTQRTPQGVDAQNDRQTIFNQIENGALAFNPKLTANKFVFFWGATSPFSNWHPSTFTANEIIFNDSEQYMMYQKAILFGDFDVAEKILLAKSPRESKSLGRLVKNFDEDVWVKHRVEIMISGCRCKFSQNPALKDALLSTGDGIMVEASPFDTVWGVGLAESDGRIFDQTKWRGLNLLGKALEVVRKELASQ